MNKHGKTNSRLHLNIAWAVFIVSVCILIQILTLQELDRDAVERMAAEYMDTHSKKKKNKKAKISGSGVMEGATVVITGATSGIGKSLATTVHGLGATVIVLGRSEKKLADLRQELGESDRVMTVTADLSDLDSVSNAADTILQKRVKKIDFLINNAGMHYGADLYSLFWTTPKLISKQGHDLAFTTNYLSHFLLTHKLLPLLERSDLDETRIIQISSLYHWLVDGTDLNTSIVPQTSTQNSAYTTMEDFSSPMASRTGEAQTFLHKNRSYANSKLAQIYHMRALSRRLRQQKSKISIVSICPAWVVTHIGGSVTRLMAHMGSFPVEGVGIQSALNAMFLPGLGGDNADDSSSISNSKDFVAQFHINVHHLFPNEGSRLARWSKTYGIRDFIVISLVHSLVVVQRFLFRPLAVITSSTESYNVEYQESLYNWSLSAIQTHL